MGQPANSFGPSLSFAFLTGTTVSCPSSMVHTAQNFADLYNGMVINWMKGHSGRTVVFFHVQNIEASQHSFPFLNVLAARKTSSLALKYFSRPTQISFVMMESMNERGLEVTNWIRTMNGEKAKEVQL
jgi:hypothetical protein